MSREIKFRAWDKYENKIRKVRGVNFTNKDLWLEIEDNRIMGANFFEVELMQYTGLKDRNDKEIYEGDIVRYFKDELGIVKFVAGSFIIDGNTCYESFLELGGKIAIVGNIYENPDLLKEELLCFIMQE